jgi:SAM-dependent methyltransferase
MTEGPDRWHRWLLDVRFGGDAAAREQDLSEFLYPVRDTVLDKAKLRPGDTLLDVGTGDGLIAFGALERLGPSGQVIFSDISQDLLDHCQAAATAEGLLDRCRFVLAAADCLTGIAQASGRRCHHQVCPDLRQGQGGGAAGVLPGPETRRAGQLVRADQRADARSGPVLRL